MSRNSEAPRPALHLYEQFVTEQLPDLRPKLWQPEEDTEEPDNKPDSEGKDNYRDNGFTQFGAFALKHAISPIEIVDKNGETVLEQGEPYMGIHLLKLSPEQAAPGYVRKSLAEVAAHLQSSGFEGKRIAGITYARLGRAATGAFGFEQAELPIAYDPEENPDVRPVVVHNTVADFVAMHADSAAQLSNA